MTAPTFLSPNKFLAKAKELMLDNREPKSKRDWLLIVNCWARNVHPECALESVQLLCFLFDVPVTKQEIKEIVDFQTAARQ